MWSICSLKVLFFFLSCKVLDILWKKQKQTMQVVCDISICSGKSSYLVLAIVTKLFIKMSPVSTWEYPISLLQSLDHCAYAQPDLHRFLAANGIILYYKVY